MWQVFCSFFSLLLKSVLRIVRASHICKEVNTLTSRRNSTAPVQLCLTMYHILSSTRKRLPYGNRFGVRRVEKDDSFGFMVNRGVYNLMATMKVGILSQLLYAPGAERSRHIMRSHTPSTRRKLIATTAFLSTSRTVDKYIFSTAAGLSQHRAAAGEMRCGSEPDFRSRCNPFIIRIL